MRAAFAVIFCLPSFACSGGVAFTELPGAELHVTGGTSNGGSLRITIAYDRMNDGHCLDVAGGLTAEFDGVAIPLSDEGGLTSDGSTCVPPSFVADARAGDRVPALDRPRSTLKVGDGSTTWSADVLHLCTARQVLLRTPAGAAGLKEGDQVELELSPPPASDPESVTLGFGGREVSVRGASLVYERPLLKFNVPALGLDADAEGTMRVVADSLRSETVNCTAPGGCAAECFRGGFPEVAVTFMK